MKLEAVVAGTISSWTLTGSATESASSLSQSALARVISSCRKGLGALESVPMLCCFRKKLHVRCLLTMRGFSWGEEVTLLTSCSLAHKDRICPSQIEDSRALLAPLFQSLFFSLRHSSPRTDFLDCCLLSSQHLRVLRAHSASPSFDDTTPSHLVKKCAGGIEAQAGAVLHGNPSASRHRWTAVSRDKGLNHGHSEFLNLKQASSKPCY